MTKNDIEALCGQVGMVKTGGDLIKPLWTASDKQITELVEIVVKQVKQTASEYVVKAIKKAAEYERGECAKIADYAGHKEVAKAIRERENE